MSKNFIELSRSILAVVILASIFISTEVFATGEPIVNTTVPSVISSSSVILTGGSSSSVAGNATTTWGVQYGNTTASYTNWINSTGSVIVYPYVYPSIMSPLIPADMYYFRAFVSGTGFINYGSEVSNMTLPNPFTSFTATPVSATSVMLSFVYSSVGVGSTPYAYVRYKEGGYPTGITDGTLLCNTTATSYTVGGLTFGHTYYFTGWQTAIHSGIFSGYPSESYAATTPSYTGGVASTAAALYENYCSTPNGTGMSPIWGPNYEYQTFTTGISAHTVSRVSLNLARTGLPGDVYVAIKRAESGIPSGVALCTGTIDGDLVSSGVTAWYDAVMTTETSLLANTQYAIIVAALSGVNGTHYIGWSNSVIAGYTGGNSGASVNNGYSWTAAAGDKCFEVLGFPALEMQSARVYQTYINSGDWLVVCNYRNVYPPYYPSSDPKANFALQLIDSSGNVMAQSSCSDWGYRPGSIYVNVASVALYTWGAGYKVRIINLNDPTVYSEYFLSPSCWVGTNLELLDGYILTIAAAMENYYNTQYTTLVQEHGKVLNNAGGVYFSVGVPYLTTSRPNLFLISSVASPAWVPNTGTQALQGTLNWRVALGPQVSAAFDSAGTVFGGVDGQIVGIMLVSFVYIILAAFVAMAGQSGAAIFLAFPVFIAGAAIGLVPLGFMFVAIAVAAFLLVWHFWLSRA